MKNSLLFFSCAASWLSILLSFPTDSVLGTTLRGNDENEIPPPKTTTLRNGKHFPLVGLGVGNLRQDKIVSQIGESMKYGTRLIDTVYTGTGNKNLVREGIVENLSWLYDDDDDDNDVDDNNDSIKMHVVSKIWYTYLGYERTKIAVREILEQLNHPNIHVHVLLNYPRCRDDVEWMRCEEEEDDLPEFIKEVGPPPHLDKANAFKESWRALEDIYEGDISLGDNVPKLESIGVSNFNLDDLEALKKSGGIMPHLIQEDVSNYVLNTNLVKYCDQNRIHFQVYNIVEGIFKYAQKSSPRALSIISNHKETIGFGEEKKIIEIGPLQVILKWLTQKDVSVVPRTRNPEHVKDNSDSSLALISDFSETAMASVTHSVVAMLKQQDLEPPTATFHNRHSDTLHIFWSNNKAEGGEGRKLHLVKEGLKPGEQFQTKTFPGHTFVAYDSNKKEEKEFIVSASYGWNEKIHLEL